MRLATNILTRTLSVQYGLKPNTLKKMDGQGRHSLFLMTDENGVKYIVKLFDSKKLYRIKREQKILSLLPKYFSYFPDYEQNSDGRIYAAIDNEKYILMVYKYIDGSSFRIGTKLSTFQLKKSATTLAKLHNIPIPQSLCEGRSIIADIHKGKKIYNKIIKHLSNSSNCFDLMIREILLHRLSYLQPEVVDIKNTQSMDILGFSFTHGDYAPSNIIFPRSGNDAYCIDWEHANIYAWQYDLFRACSNFASSGRFTPYDSTKDMLIIKYFLEFYFKERGSVSQDEINMFKYMPKLFCFIDTFPFHALYLDKRVETKKYLPKNKKSYLWWEYNEKRFGEIVQNVYEKNI